MEIARQERAEAVLAVIRRWRWGLLVLGVALISFLPQPWAYVGTPAILLWWTPIVVDSVRAFREGRRQPDSRDRVGTSAQVR